MPPGFLSASTCCVTTPSARHRRVVSLSGQRAQGQHTDQADRPAAPTNVFVVGLLGLGIEIWADGMVKHATPPPGLDIKQAAEDTVIRGLADAVIVSGAGTGWSQTCRRQRWLDR